MSCKYLPFCLSKSMYLLKVLIMINSSARFISGYSSIIQPGAVSSRTYENDSTKSFVFITCRCLYASSTNRIGMVELWLGLQENSRQSKIKEKVCFISECFGFFVIRSSPSLITLTVSTIHLTLQSLRSRAA